MADHDATRVHLRMRFDTGTMLGPGKAELLERITETGSISAAGRAMAMSYKRAWLLVQEMNNAFLEPLVDSTRGGQAGGGARITEAGARVLAAYRRAENAARMAAAPEMAVLRSMMSDISDRK